MKSKTHVYMANLIIEELRVNEGITLPENLGQYAIPSEIRLAILNHPDEFRAGATGPDFYPDIQIGQTIVHPKDSGSWLRLMFTEFSMISSYDPERSRSLAFLLGFMMHYSADLYGHEYVNRWAMGWFPEVKEALTDLEKMQKIVRHVLVETYMDQKVPQNQATGLSMPIKFVRNCFLNDEALSRYPSNVAMKYAEEMRLCAFNKAQSNVAGIIDVFNYFSSWEQDLDRGINAWLNTWHNVTVDMTANNKTLEDAKQEISRWVSDYFVYMTPAPDMFADFMKVLDQLNIFKPVKEMIIEEAKVFMNDFVRAATGIDVADALEEMKHMMQDPALYLNNGVLYNDRNITAQLDIEFENFGQSSDTLCQGFHAFQQCLNMGKLCLLGPDNLNRLIEKGRGSCGPVFSKLLCTGSLEAVSIRIKTKKNGTLFWGIPDPTETHGTDDNVYFAVMLNTGETLELLLDRPGYNDFESDDNDTYYFKLPKRVSYDAISGFRLRKDYIAVSDDWTPESMTVTDQVGRALWDGGINCTLSGRTPYNIGVNGSGFVENGLLPVDHRIISFLYSLDGVGKNDLSNPTAYKQWTDDQNIFFSDSNLRENVHNKLFGAVSPYTYVPRPFHLGWSKGIDCYVSNEKCDLTVVLSATDNTDGVYPGGVGGGSYFNHYEIYAKLMELSGTLTMKCLAGENEIVRKYAQVNPYTGNLRDTDLGNLLDTHPIITGDAAVSYGFYDAGKDKSHQAYLYATKNQANWMGELMSSNVALRLKPFAVFALPGSHDSGMFTGINSDEAAHALISGLISKYATAEKLTEVLKAAFLGDIAASTLSSLAEVIFKLDTLTSVARRALINLAYTQKDDIMTQLLLGTRWFDFRPGYNLVNNDGVLRHQHNFVPGYEYDRFLNDVVQFLDGHPNELVIISINYNGFMENTMVPTRDVVNEAINKALSRSTTQVIQAGPEAIGTPIGQLLEMRKRIIFIHQDRLDSSKDELAINFTGSYSDSAYATDVPDTIIAAIEATIRQPQGAAIQGAVLQLQGTYTNKIFESKSDIVATIASLSDASSPLLSTKAKFDAATYQWISNNLNNDRLSVANSGLLIFLNDFVDNLLVNRMVELTQERSMDVADICADVSQVSLEMSM